MPDESRLPTLPFAGTDDATRRAIGEAITGVDAMIRMLVRRQFPALCEADRDDLAQEVRIRLATYSLPRFDPSRGVKLSTFLHVCIANYLRRRLPRSKGRGTRRKSSQACEDVTHLDIEAPDQTPDRAVERLAATIVADPRAFGLTYVEAEILRALRDAAPGDRLCEVARRLGYAVQSSMSKPYASLRSKLASLDIDAGADDENLGIFGSHMAKPPRVSPIPSSDRRQRRKLAVASGDGSSAGDTGGDGVPQKRAGVPVHGGSRAA